MGPQHESCGKRALPKDIVRWVDLQWGRNMRVAESNVRVWLAQDGPVLQWGRNMRVAESSRAP